MAHTKPDLRTKEDKIAGFIVDTAVTIALGTLTYLMYDQLSKLLNIQRDPHSAALLKNTQGNAPRLGKILENREKSRAAADSSYVKKTPPPLILTDYEIVQAENCIDPAKIVTRFVDIGGIDKIKSEIYDLVVLPLLRPDLFRSESGLVSPPKGILLFGMPGTGKTMLAKALAKESNASFVNVRLSSILNKYLGESNKMVSAIFSLAAKIAPSVIFIDEIDTFLRQRDSDESSGLGSTKSEFLTLWDGMTTDEERSEHVIVLGATNRPFDVDTAILRRLPRTFEIGLPKAAGRLAILNLLLQKQPMSKNCTEFVKVMSEDGFTKGYSGSDLKEVCRAAAMNPIREITKEMSLKAVGVAGAGGDGKQPTIGERVRPLEKNDFLLALSRVKRTGESAAGFVDEYLNNKT